MPKPEKYNDYGEIIEQVENKPFTRRMGAYDNHIIHRTKDLYESTCTYCIDDSIKRAAFTCSECQENCYTRQKLNEHWLLEH